MKIIHKEIKMCRDCPYLRMRSMSNFQCALMGINIYFKLSLLDKILIDCPLPDKQEQTPIRTSPEN